MKEEKGKRSLDCLHDKKRVVRKRIRLVIGEQIANLIKLLIAAVF